MQDCEVSKYGGRAKVSVDDGGGGGGGRRYAVRLALSNIGVSTLVSRGNHENSLVSGTDERGKREAGVRVSRALGGYRCSSVGIMLEAGQGDLHVKSWELDLGLPCSTRQGRVPFM